MQAAVQQTAVKANILAFLHECRQRKHVHHAKRLHAYMYQQHLDSDPTLGNCLVCVLAECGLPADAELVFDRIHISHRDEHSWTSLIAGYNCSGQPHHAFRLYHKMEEEACVQPTRYTYVAMLTAFARLENPERGRKLHEEATKRGFERELFVGSALVEMYGKCSLLTEARQVFDRLLVRNAVSWTTLVSRYTEHGLGNEVLKCLEQMQLELVSMDAATFACCLKACGITRASETGRQMHSETTKSGLEGELYIGSTLVDMYLKCNLLAEAAQVFDRLLVRNAVSWNVLITGYSERGYGDEVLDCFREMQVEGISPDALTFVSTLKACSSIADLQTGREIHSEVMKMGLESEPYIGNAMVDMYAKCAHFTEAWQVFYLLPTQDAVTWNALITGYAECGYHEEVLNCFGHMQLKGAHADAVTFLCSLKACGTMRASKTSQELHGRITQRGLETALHVGNALVDVYSKCGLLAEARKVLDWLQPQDSIAWNALIAGYAEHGLEDEVLNGFEQMQLQGVCMDSGSFSCMLKASGILEAPEMGQGAHSELTIRGLESELLLGNLLMDMYGRCRLHAEAHHVFERLPVRDVASWNAWIGGYSDNGLDKQALDCFKHMQLQGVCADSVTFTYSLKACGMTGAFDTTQQLHAEITKRGLERELHLAGSLVDTYGKCSLLGDACRVFDTQSVRDAVLWNTVIAAQLEFGHGKEALNLFRQMQLEGVAMDDVTIVCTLKACEVLEASITAQEMHAEILKRGLENDPYMGSTLVGTYGKCGLLTDAHHLFDSIEVKNWDAFLSAYSDYGLFEETLGCFKQMQLNGMIVDTGTYRWCLKACGALGDVEAGRALDAEITARGLESEVHISSTLVGMYGKCGWLAEAHSTFYHLPARNLVSWTSLIIGYTDFELHDEVLKCSRQMDLEGVPLDGTVVVCILRACGGKGTLGMGRVTHAELAKKGLERELNLGSMLVDMYGRCGSFGEAQQVFYRLPVRNVVSWTALITGYDGHGLGEEVLKCFLQMQLEGTCMDAGISIFVMKACGQTGALEKGREIHSEVIKRGLERELFVGSTVVDMYCKGGLLAEAHHVCEALPVRNEVVWTTMIVGYVEHGLGKEVLDCFKQMQLDQVNKDAITYACSLKACGMIKALGTGYGIHAEVIKMGLERETHVGVGNALVNMYGKCGMHGEAYNMVRKMPIQDVDSWNSLIAGFVEHELFEDVLECFGEMCVDGVPLNAVTFVCSLKSCGSTKALEKGQQLHAETIKRGLERAPFLGSALVDMYVKCNALPESRVVFDKSPAQNAVVWTSLITGYAEHGLLEEVLKCLKKMQFEGVSVDAVTFVSCLKACSAIGALEAGKEIHGEIRNAGFEKDPYVGHSLIHMYGKCGLVGEGEKLFDKLLVKDVVSWTTMINVYGENNQGNMAVQCFKEMQEQAVKPNSVTFVSLLAACSRASLVLEGQSYFTLMRETHGIEPTVEHFACMVDLFARTGQFQEAERFIKAMQCPLSNVILMVVLSACKVHGEVELGESCFQELVKINEEDASAYLLTVDMFATVGRLNDAGRLEMRNHAQARRKPSAARVEVNQKLPEFVVGANQTENELEMPIQCRSHVQDNPSVITIEKEATSPEYVNNTSSSSVKNHKGNIVYGTYEYAAVGLLHHLGLDSCKGVTSTRLAAKPPPVECVQNLMREHLHRLDKDTCDLTM